MKTCFSSRRNFSKLQHPKNHVKVAKSHQEPSTDDIVHGQPWTLGNDTLVPADEDLPASRFTIPHSPNNNNIFMQILERTHVRKAMVSQELRAKHPPLPATVETPDQHEVTEVME